MNISKLLFSFKGSISRSEYVAGFCIEIVIAALLIGLPGQLIGNTADLPAGMKLLTAFIYLCGIIIPIIVSLAIATKRLRNLKWSLWLLLLLFVPIVNFGMLIAFLSIRGEAVTRTTT